ncbi:MULTISPECIES: alpha-hydroxy-acid oxidizing protein [unclassified Crossiella]|uniref:alpha-hydroxy-acid oxidizing protein n=1 Tax=unclassified Crossiella TaxID=2620835 RepID=UPI001FFEE6B0|nr:MULTISPECIES: alpha-hydroxy-acid oxidizing protein [unclassified Crossiella]MCK2239967.1 alpha-hydroxy-acid oxidizing protein [Crossiella sp. S99.2]MCK2252675.1 alpha-hydroxy-acid oxidizing protein [Crossiella sp. S99.1]
MDSTARVTYHRTPEPSATPWGTGEDTGRNPLSAQHAHLQEGARRGRRPRWPTTLEDFETEARRVLSADDHGRDVLAYLFGTAGRGRTAAANLAAFDDHTIITNVLRRVDLRDHRITLFGTPMAAPLLLAPVGGLDLIEPRADISVAEAAAHTGLTWIHSPAASVTPEEVNAQVPGGHRWFELMLSADDTLNHSMIHRAQRTGHTVLVVNLDTPVIGWRSSLFDHGWPFDHGYGAATFRTDPIFAARLRDPEDPAEFGRQFAALFNDGSRTPNDLALVRSRWTGTLLVKGILTARDAHLATQAGADGIIVSNHGGRQQDRGVATLHALAHVIHGAHGVPVLLDGGIRSGADMLIALALGAQAVLIGLPYALGLAVDGYDGVRHVLDCLLADYDRTMAVAGYRSPSELGPAALYSRPRTASLPTRPWPSTT